MEDPSSEQPAIAIPPPADWVRFLFTLGSELATLQQGGRCPMVFVIVPAIEFAPLLIAGGFITQTARNAVPSADNASIERFRPLVGRAVKFPRLIKGKMKLLRGNLEAIEGSPGGEYLKIKYAEGRRKNHLISWAHIKAGDFDVVSACDAQFEIPNHQQGERLAGHIAPLEELVGRSGIRSLLSRKSNTCWIADTKRRVIEELTTCIAIKRLTGGLTDSQIQLWDLVRPDFAQKRAVAASSQSHVESRLCANTGYVATIAAKPAAWFHYTQHKNPVIVGVVTPMMNGFLDAVNHANNRFLQRSADIKISDELLTFKPASIDLQLWEESSQ